MKGNETTHVQPFLGTSMRAGMLRALPLIVGGVVLSGGLIDTLCVDVLSLDVVLARGVSIVLAIAIGVIGFTWIARSVPHVTDITNRKQTEQALQTSQEQYRLLFHNMLDGFALCQMHFDDGRPVDFTYLDVNASFETITGLKGVTGRRVSEVIPGIREANPELFDIYGRVADTGMPDTFETYVAGLGIWLSIAVHSPAKGLFVSIFEDVTERKEKEILRTTRMNLMNHAASHSLEEVMQETLDQVTHITHSPIGYCHLVDPDQTTISLHAWSTRTLKEFRPAEGQGAQYGENGAEALSEAMREGKPAVRNEYPSLPDGGSPPEGRTHVTRELVVPISRNGLIVAVLGVGNKAVPYADHDVKVATYFADIVWEIAELKRAEKTLLRSEELFRVAAQNLSDVVYEWDMADTIDWYGNIDALLGFSPGEFPRSLNAWFERIHEDDRPLVALAIEGHLKGDIAYNCEYRVQPRNGDWRHWSARGVALRLPSGQPYRWIGSITDITDQVNARKALDLSERKYHTLYGTMRDAFVSVDMSGKIMEFNEAYRAMLGYTEEELRALTSTDITPRKWHAAEARILDEQVLPRGYSELYEMEYRAKGGRTIPIELRTKLVIDDAGTPSSMWAIVRDITIRKEAEAELAASEERFRSTFEQAAVGIAHVALDGRWLRVNERLCAIVGYTREELLVMSFADITHPEDLQSELEFVRQMLANERQQYSMEKRYIRKDGSAIWVNLTVSLLRHPGGDPMNLISVVEDISQRKKVDQELRDLTDELDSRVKERTFQLQTANMELESFSYSVSHDLRAPLRGIDGWSLALLREYGGMLDERGSKYLERVRSETQRMGELIDDMLMLAKVARSDLRRTDFDFSDIVHRVMARVRERYPDREFDVVVEPRMTMDADPHLMDIVLTNLIDNACKFTRERSPAHIEIGQVEQNGKQCWFVRDNGVGFDMTYAKKLFAPFQRMHRQSEYPGTGVGLATVQRIISRHNGTVWIDAQKHKGATVYFSL